MKLRKVEPVAKFEDEILQEFAKLSMRCAEGAEFLLEELEEHEPDLRERCGLLQDRFEVYALSIPGCAKLKFVVSLDTVALQPWPCVVHGFVANSERSCEHGRSLAVRHLGLINPSWEPANG